MSFSNQQLSFVTPYLRVKLFECPGGKWFHPLHPIPVATVAFVGHPSNTNRIFHVILQCLRDWCFLFKDGRVKIPLKSSKGLSITAGGFNLNEESE